MKLSLIVALDRNGLIGRSGGLPWRLPADLQHFKKVTLGKPVIMGRRTCESLPGPLPGRQNLVLTKNQNFKRSGFDVFTDAAVLLKSIQRVDESMVIGGAEIYRLLLPDTGYAYITTVDGDFTGDTWFPEWPLIGWRTVSTEFRPSDDRNPHAMTFTEWEKVEKI